MAYLLDTNVISELVRPRPDARVTAWVAGQSTLDLHLSVLTLGEVGQGVSAMAGGARRDQLARWLEYDLPHQFLGRLLGVDAEVARRWGELGAAARLGGRPLPTVDGLLLATAAVHGLALATRNARDCAGRGVDVVDPWHAGG